MGEAEAEFRLQDGFLSLLLAWPAWLCKSGLETGNQVVGFSFDVRGRRGVLLAKDSQARGLLVKAHLHMTP